MAEYYLISQLPTLDSLGENTPLPITEERFLELCKGLLKDRIYEKVANLTLIPSKEQERNDNALIDAWNSGEKNLRLALCKVRSEKYNKPFESKDLNFSNELLKVAGNAIEMESPLEAENYLLSYRLSFLEELRPMDNFSDDFIYYYALKLKLLYRMRKFSTQEGETVYKNIYDSIINGDRLEAI